MVSEQNRMRWNMTEGMERMELFIESASQNESFARVAVAAFMARLDPTLEETDDVKTAVSEAVTNAIIHGYAERSGIVKITAVTEAEDKKLTVIVEDQGCGIADIKKAMEPMYSAIPGERSGMGFCFMEAFMDELSVVSSLGNGTKIQMKKNIGRRV